MTNFLKDFERKNWELKVNYWILIENGAIDGYAY